jgi:hypothetical protein
MTFSYVGFLQFIILKSALQIYSSLVLRRHSIRPEHNAVKVNLRILILKALKIVLTEKPFSCLNCLIWDFTCADTLCKSYVKKASKEVGSAAAGREEKK